MSETVKRNISLPRELDEAIRRRAAERSAELGRTYSVSEYLRDLALEDMSR